MATHNPRSRAGRIQQDGIKLLTVPPCIGRRRVGRQNFGLQAQPLQILANARTALWVNIERNHLGIAQFQQMCGLAARCSAGIQDAAA